MNHVRLHGDPFGDDASAAALRRFLRSAQEAGLRASLSPAVVPERPPRATERSVPPADGRRSWEIATDLPEDEVEWLLAAAEVAVVATAPLVVFAAAPIRDDVVRMAGLQWSRACAVLTARCETTTTDLLNRVRAEFRWAGHERQPDAQPEAKLRPWLELESAPRRCFVHASNDVFACGTDLVVSTFARDFADRGVRLRLVLSGISAEEREALVELAGTHRAQVEVLAGPLRPEHVRDARTIVQPSRCPTQVDVLVQALASGRPVVTTRFGRTAAVTAGRGVVLEVQGREVPEGCGRPAHCAPEPGSLVNAWNVAQSASIPSGVGRRARRYVVEELVSGRPFAAPPPLEPAGARRPRIVIEAPWFDQSATAELAVATARTLIARDEVDVQLASTGVFRRDLAWLREAAPELESRLHRQPGRADLWLSAGWSSRAERPSCRRWAVQSDWEYGALPFEAPPAIVDGVDLVVVPDEGAYQLLMAAGLPADSVQLVKHGSSVSAPGSDPASADFAPSLANVAADLEQLTREAAGVTGATAAGEPVVALPTPAGMLEARAPSTASPSSPVELATP